jgi:hypothetical protein
MVSLSKDEDTFSSFFSILLKARARRQQKVAKLA